jgi:hypothetical protein
MSRYRVLCGRWRWLRLQRLWGDAVCLVRHPHIWKWDGQGTHGKRWVCRRCGRRWAYRWR